MVLQVRAMDLVQFLQRLVASFASLADRKKIALSFEPQEKELVTFIDQERVEKIITNLLSPTIRRRRLIAAGALCLAPVAGRAQPTRKIPRIGMLGVGSAPAEMAGSRPKSPLIAAFLGGLRDLGYTYGDHYETEPRSAEGQAERFPALVADLVRLQVDVIVAAGPALAALRQGTSTVPVVMAGAEDPVGLGVVKSLGRPGTNFTGLSNQAVEATVKKLELLKELSPGPAPVAVLWDPAARLSWQAVQASARQRGWKLLSFEVRDLAGIETAIQAAVAARSGPCCRLAGSSSGTHGASPCWPRRTGCRRSIPIRRRSAKPD